MLFMGDALLDGFGGKNLALC
ncbi:hypothetical protein Goari_007874, partial [Gossypium aridum]|nr:hypothetical protein [Gossypium aridum]